jgi:putative membrane protein
MTALRHSMRMPKPWETIGQEKTNQEWTDTVHPPERDSTVEEDMKPYLSDSDLEYVMSKNNKQTAVLYLQSHHLRRLKDNGVIWEFAFLQLEGVLEELFTLQGKSERIKNFPYPRHFATLNHYFMWLFVLLLPLALIPQFAEIGSTISENQPMIGQFFVWLAVPFYAVVAWIFHTMERIGRTGENPFEGSANDVPISTIARGIEIDLRQNLGENKEEIPSQFPMVYDTQF